MFERFGRIGISALGAIGICAVVLAVPTLYRAASIWLAAQYPLLALPDYLPWATYGLIAVSVHAAGTAFAFDQQRAGKRAGLRVSSLAFLLVGAVTLMLPMIPAIDTWMSQLIGGADSELQPFDVETAATALTSGALIVLGAAPAVQRISRTTFESLNILRTLRKQLSVRVRADYLSAWDRLTAKAADDIYKAARFTPKAAYAIADGTVEGAVSFPARDAPTAKLLILSRKARIDSQITHLKERKSLILEADELVFVASGSETVWCLADPVRTALEESQTDDAPLEALSINLIGAPFPMNWPFAWPVNHAETSLYELVRSFSGPHRPQRFILLKSGKRTSALTNKSLAGSKSSEQVTALHIPTAYTTLYNGPPAEKPKPLYAADVFPAQHDDD